MAYGRYPTDVKAAAPAWSDFSYVVSSRYREQVFAALGARPKLPRELAETTRLRLGHVSRALRELSDRRLVACLTPELRARGRLYGLTPQGAAVLNQLVRPVGGAIVASTEDIAPRFVPKIRASTVLRMIQYLRQTRGSAPVAQTMKEWGVDVDELAEDSWLPVETCARLLELIERNFGDGSYGFVREAFREAVVTFPTVREQLSKALPLAALSRHAPTVYAQEWNYGRLEVAVTRRRAVLRHYDWTPTPAMCALFHGVYEGILQARGVKGRVVKSRCIRVGDPYCEYVVEW
ncbi:MAG: hypothetical protein L3K14_04270 [Thermoplasmata archaeon]|nr:hypothetical protein [Thermoplasmata archaeon]